MANVKREEVNCGGEETRCGGETSECALAPSPFTTREEDESKGRGLLDAVICAI